eukprot:5303260-Pyramimonas_sp.AAC.1
MPRPGQGGHAIRKTPSASRLGGGGVVFSRSRPPSKRPFGAALCFFAAGPPGRRMRRTRMVQDELRRDSAE